MTTTPPPSSGAVPQDARPDGLLAELLGLEHAGWEALCHRGGAEFYDRVMTDDAVMIVAGGAVLDRAAVLDAFRNSPGWTAYEISEARLVSILPECAAIVYRGTGFRSETLPYAATMTSLYRAGEAGWQLAMHVQVEITA